MEKRIGLIDTGSIENETGRKLERKEIAEEGNDIKRKHMPLESVSGS